MRALVLAFLIACTFADRAAAQATLLTGLGGPVGLGEGSLTPNDDDSTSFIDLTAAFPVGLRYYGMIYPGVYVNNNGNVSFGAPLGSYTPSAFPLAASQPAMIAPWWGDVDTRNRTGVGDANLVYYDISPGRFIATWFDVGYYSQHNELRVSVQLIITDASEFGVAGAFDIELRYNRCEWTTGDASGGSGGFGGNPAGAGFDAADGVNFQELPGSRTAAVTSLCTSSNAGEPGVWRFQVRPGGVTVCGNAVRELGEECDDGNVVNGDGCNARCGLELPAGSACADDIACRSGFCADGVCCSARCDGQCEACAETGLRGTCVAVSGTPRGSRPACDGAGTTCGATCSGTSRATCSYTASGTLCNDGSSCSTGDVCDGAGRCAGVGLICDDGLSCTADECAGGVCSASLLPGFCFIDGECQPAGAPRPDNACQVCDPATSVLEWTARGGSCDDGNACTTGDTCGAGACVPGVATVCADDGLGCTAEACDPFTGLCGSSVTDGCVIEGACVATGTLDPATPCRACDPSKNPRGFTNLEIGTRCAEPSCDAGVLTLAAACDGLGSCAAPDTLTCPSGLCEDPVMCLGPCAGDAECPGARFCEAGACLDDRGDGEGCGRDDECASGLCIDGVCCSGACDGTCESCAVAGSEGTCTPFGPGTDPDDECVDPLACDGASACEEPPPPPVDAGMPDAGEADAGETDAGEADAGTPVRDAGPFDAGGLDAGGLDAGAGAVSSGGCGCSVPRGPDGHGAGFALFALALGLVVRRRR